MPSDIDELAVACIRRYLVDRGFENTLRSLQTDSQSSSQTLDNVPLLTDLIQTFLLSTNAVNTSNTPSTKGQLVIPDKATTTLDKVHTSNILSLNYHALTRQRFDVDMADYMHV